MSKLEEIRTKLLNREPLDVADAQMVLGAIKHMAEALIILREQNSEEALKLGSVQSITLYQHSVASVGLIVYEEMLK